MNDQIIEVNYPLNFRQEDTKTLAEHITLRHSVELVGMKRVGISNFLRFFLNKKEVHKNYLEKGHLFITVDLNDLIERELYPFWILTFKRIVDILEEKNCISKATKKNASDLFLNTIQTQDLFLTIENIRTVIKKLTEEGIIPTIFFLRFDRLEKTATPDLLANLQSLIDTSNHKLSYVFTSVRPLDQISPEAFPRKNLSGFTHIQYLRPANPEDTKIILKTFTQRYNIVLSPPKKRYLLSLTDGHTQYLHLALIILNENKNKAKNNKEIYNLLANDERINLQSEEILDTLTDEEKNFLTNTIVHLDNKKSSKNIKYLLYTGIIDKHKKPFNPLFAKYIKETAKQDLTVDFTKKEHLLFTLLNENKNEICEREMIIKSVWPEYEEIGVSDWTIDRLVARLRAKLKLQNTKLNIITIKTRGYKLTSL